MYPIARFGGLLLAVTVFALGGCASLRSGDEAPAPAPVEVYRSLLGHNQGLKAVRAVAEAHFSFAGRDVSLPGVLLLDSFGGFRLDLLDPLDLPLAIMFVEDGRIVNYRPGPGLAASLGVFPADCRGIDPSDWVSAILASSAAPVAGETLAETGLWFGGRLLKINRRGALHQSIRYENADGQPTPRKISWYCGDETVLELRPREWVQGTAWRLPSRFDIRFPKAGLSMAIELREIEGNPPSSTQPLRPQLGSEIRWTSWNLPR